MNRSFALSGDHCDNARSGGAQDDDQPGGARHIASSRKATIPMAKSAGAKIALVQTGV
jgi:hypothetical protein